MPMRTTSSSTPTGRGKRRAVARRSIRQHAGVHDRGTILLMVLGVLALMAIIAVVYAALGKSDRAASASIVRSTRVDDQVDQIADYLSGVIRDDLFSTYMLSDGRPAGQSGTLRWEGTDYAHTDPQMLSQLPLPAENANRAPYRFNPAGTYNTRRTVGNAPDPRQPSDPFLASSEPEWLTFKAGQNNPTDARRPYLDKQDWPAISNFAPSGNFVNLFYLRNRFKAESGFGNDASGSPRLSENLSLLDENGNVTFDLPNSGPLANPKRPADWTNNQISAFRPMYDAVGIDVNSPDHINYQWCDTDGDGFADARWFELVDVWNQRDVRAVIPNSGRARLFIAARCKDLSGSVNVNTAGDMNGPPGYVPDTGFGGLAIHLLPGSGPQDVDLLRILGRSDGLDSLGANGECYRECAQPPTNSAGDYRAFGPNESLAGGSGAYLSMWAMRDPARTTPANNGTQYNRVLPKEIRYPASSNLPLPSAVDRLQYYSRFGSSLGGARYTGVNSREVVGTFDAADELELRTFESVNDSTRQSRLEAVTTGRASTVPALERYDPLRSNRPRNVEMSGRDGAVASNEALLAAEVDVRRLLTTMSASRQLVDRAVASAEAFDPTKPENNLRTDATQLIAGLRTSTSSDAQDLARLKHAYTAVFFREYADALMPYTDSDLFPDAWDPIKGSGLSYGGRTELAYMMAAHLAMNLRASVGEKYLGQDGPESQIPPVATLDMTPASVDAMAGGSLYTDQYPWPKLNFGTNVAGKRRLTPDNAFIKGTQVDTSTGGVAKRNVFGITPQPFITHATAMNFFVDAPPTIGGDDDVSGRYTTGPMPEPRDPITINIAQKLDNPDFLFSVIAFQLTNPFDVAVDIEPELFDTRSFYYIEYAGRTYRLRPQDTANNMGSGFKETLDSGMGETKLHPRETRVYYATFPAGRLEVETRVNDARAGIASRLGIPQSSTMFDLESFSEHEFGEFPIHMALVYPETGVAVKAQSGELTSADLHATQEDYLVPPPAGLVPGMPRLDATRPERRVVNLWRVIRDEQRPLEGPQPGTSTVGIDGPTANNSRLNDQLVDRLRDPSAQQQYADGVLITSLIDPFGAGNLGLQVPNTRSGDDSAGVAAAYDNIGFAFATYASISRPTNPATPTVDEPDCQLGAMPIWCFEAKADNQILRSTATPNIRLSMNQERVATGLPDGDDFRANRNSSYDSLGEMIDDICSIGGSIFVDSDLHKKVEEKTNNPYSTIDMLLRTNAQTPPGLPREVKGYTKIAPVFRGFSGNDNFVAGATNSNSRGLFSRVGDLLLPLAIGPSYDPLAVGNDVNAPDILVVSPGAERIKNLEAQWTTLAEALALVGDYYSPTNPEHPYFQFGRDTRSIVAPGAVPAIPKSDRGCLMLDAWAPYLERDNNTFFNPGIDEPLGNGIPLALNILDQFSVSGQAGWSGVPVPLPDLDRISEIVGGVRQGSATQPVHGLININTAPRTVMRALPLLAPRFSGWLKGPATDPTTTLAARINPSRLVPPVPAMLWDNTQPLSHWDIATTLQAYRDKLALNTRRFVSGQSGAPVEVNFRDDRTGAGPFRKAPGTNTDVTGREDATGIDHLRTGSGFKSIGEIMLAEIRKSTDSRVRSNNTGSGTVAPDIDNSITRLGLDKLANYSPALDAGVVFNAASTTYESDRVVDDYSEKLTIANAVLNTITVRSDVFCIWFVIQGYTPEDVAVEDGFPMVPSIARRYVMVVDRSNVITANARPRIVMLKEVPLR